MADVAELNDDPIICQIDNAKVHSVQSHLTKNHPEWTMDRYKETYPDAPILSDKAKRIVAANKANKAKSQQAEIARPARQRHFHELFELGNAKAALNAAGQPVNVTVIETHSENVGPYIAEIDPNYVFNIDLTKKVLVGMELNMPVYLWGYHGTGKTTLLEQVGARTRRPFMRVQHTINTEESHILGQYVVRSKPVEVEELDSAGVKHTVIKQQTVTEFQLGPLPLAMIEGMIYCADEYDFAMPSVSAVYQSVLEGKALVIKDAPPEFRVIKPHPEFRFVATGNTNGVGDETGLYQGTLIQNAANYSRFPITEEVEYMDAKIEVGVLMAQAAIDKTEAEKIVKFAKEIRNSFSDGKISMTISPRELINAAVLGVAFGANWSMGLKLAFANRLSRVDKKVVEDYLQRVFA